MIRGALGWILFPDRRQRLRDQLWDHPASLLGHRDGGIVLVVGKSESIGMRIDIIRDPVSQGDLIVAGTAAGIDVTGDARLDMQLDPGFGEGLLQRHRNRQKRLILEDGEVKLERRLAAGICQDLLSLFDIQFLGIVFQGAREADREEGRVDIALAAQQVAGDAVVIKELARRFKEGRIAQFPAALGVDENRVGARRGDRLDREFALLLDRPWAMSALPFSTCSRCAAASGTFWTIMLASLGFSAALAFAAKTRASCGLNLAMMQAPEPADSSAARHCRYPGR